MTYLLSFALSTCALVHTALYHGKSLIDGLRKMKVENDDIHAKLTRNYREVPEWWFFCIFFCVAVIAVKVGCFIFCCPFGSSD
jgi:OPT oligopeptide transporter protein